MGWKQIFDIFVNSISLPKGVNKLQLSGARTYVSQSPWAMQWCSPPFLRSKIDFLNASAQKMFLGARDLGSRDHHIDGWVDFDLKNLNSWWCCPTVMTVWGWDIWVNHKKMASPFQLKRVMMMMMMVMTTIAVLVLVFFFVVVAVGWCCCCCRCCCCFVQFVFHMSCSQYDLGLFPCACIGGGESSPSNSPKCRLIRMLH